MPEPERSAEAARCRLPRPVFDYLEGDAEDERTLRRNRQAFSDFALIPRVCQPVGTIDAQTSLLGVNVEWPFIVGPAGMPGLPLLSYIAEQLDPNLSWRDVEWVTRHWTGPLAVKGSMLAEDAELACNCGASSIILSNHVGESAALRPCSER